MTINAASQQLEDLIVSKIVELGCACAVDLAGQIGCGVKPNDLLPLLHGLVAKGILRRKVSTDDPRAYSDNQIIYELVR